MRLLALGDSYTVGEGVDATERWPVQLARVLASAPPEIVAATGWTTDELAAAMDAQAFSPPYDLVTLLIGVNNQYRGRSVANFRDEFAALLARAIALAGQRPQRVVVVSIPDWGVTRFAQTGDRDVARIAEDIDAFNAAAAQICHDAGVRVVDVTALSRADATLLVADGLHPNGAAYRRWTQVIAPVAQQALRSAS